MGVEPGGCGDVVGVGGAGDSTADELAVDGGVNVPEGDVIEEGSPAADIACGGEPEPLLPAVGIASVSFVPSVPAVFF